MPIQTYIFPEVTSTATQRKLPTGTALPAKKSTTDFIPSFSIVQRTAFNRKYNLESRAAHLPTQTLFPYKKTAETTYWHK